MAGSNHGLPSWHKGRLLLETFSDFWYGEREGKLFNQEGRMVDRANFDSLTDRQRAENIQRRIR